MIMGVGYANMPGGRAKGRARGSRELARATGLVFGGRLRPR
jgi:hypothetical protein